MNTVVRFFPVADPGKVISVKHIQNQKAQAWIAYREDRFAYIGAFSPAIDITNTTKDYDGDLANTTRLNQQLKLLWIGIGSDDFLFAHVKESHATLEKAGIRHVWVESSGAHVWTVGRKYLADFAPRLFQ